MVSLVFFYPFYCFAFKDIIFLLIPKYYFNRINVAELNLGNTEQMNTNYVLHIMFILGFIDGGMTGVRKSISSYSAGTQLIAEIHEKNIYMYNIEIIIRKKRNKKIFLM